MTTELETDKPEALDSASQNEGTSESRRQLLRAGLAAAPVLMAMKSRSVLACGGTYSGGTGVKQLITTSAFASIQAANAAGITLSHRASGLTPLFRSHNEWKTCGHPAPYNQKQNCYFHDKSAKKARSSWTECRNWNGDPNYSTDSYSYYKRWGCNYSGFASKDNYRKLGDRTLQETLYCDDPLARHLVATLLNKSAGYDPNNVLPSKTQCLAIWNGNGAWTPPNCTKTWSRADTIAWFDMCYGTCST